MSMIAAFGDNNLFPHHHNDMTIGHEKTCRHLWLEIDAKEINVSFCKTERERQ